MNTLSKTKYLLFLFAMTNLIFLFLFNVTKAETVPAEKPPIKIGMTLDLSSKSKDSRAPLKLGTEIYFDRINAAGGIAGRKLELIALDDQYDPVLAAKNVRELIDTDQVLAMTSNVGTNTGIVTLPIIDEKKVLSFAPRSGADIFRKNPPDRYIINFRSSFTEEVTAMIKGLIAAGVKPNEFAFFTENDAYGDDVYHGCMKALKETGFPNPEILPYGRQLSSTVNIEGALGQIIGEAKTAPKVFILGGSSISNTKFINLAIKQYPHAIFATISGYVFPAQLDSTSDNKIISTQVVPSLNSDLVAVSEYREDLKKYGGGAAPTYFSLEGYLAARLLVVALQHAAVENKLTREGLIDVFEKMRNVDIGIGVKITIDKTNHQALHTLWLIKVKNGAFTETNWPEIKLLLHQ